MKSRPAGQCLLYWYWWIFCCKDLDKFKMDLHYKGATRDISHRASSDTRHWNLLKIKSSNFSYYFKNLGHVAPNMWGFLCVRRAPAAASERQKNTKIYPTMDSKKNKFIFKTSLTWHSSSSAGFICHRLIRSYTADSTSKSAKALSSFRIWAEEKAYY